MTAAEVEVDPFDARRAAGTSGLLAAFNAARVLGAADVHVARRLGAALGEERDAVLLACALAVRAPRLGHVCTDLASARATVAADTDAPVELDALPWPAPDAWQADVATSPLVGSTDGSDDRPLRLEGTRLYLDRYWRQERQVAADLVARAASPSAPPDHDVLDALVARLLPAPTDALPRAAVLSAAQRNLTVIAGGPGTGKTTTVARMLAALDAAGVSAGDQPPRVALVAPTGKAATRLEEAVHAEVAGLDVPEATRERLGALEASTIHRLLGWRPGSRSRFRHDRTNRLPHDLVVVDETSMVSLSLMAALVEAVRVNARLVLVGDPEQLASVEAGAVLGDVVVPASQPSTPLSGSLVRLRHVHRYRGAIANLAEAVQRGDADGAVAVLRAGGGNVTWVEVASADDPGDGGESSASNGSSDGDGIGAGQATGASDALAPVRAAVVAAGRAVLEHARTGDAAAALEALGRMRVLCAHRRGPYGAARWARTVERWLAADVPGYAAHDQWYPGRPLLVTANDHALRLYNGDTGVVVDGRDRGPVAAFDRRGDVLEVSPTRLSAVETVHAMTVHKSQGSQFAEVALVLPDATSPILTRELLYTGATRAREHLTIVGSEESVRVAVARPIARASGLADRLR